MRPDRAQGPGQHHHYHHHHQYQSHLSETEHNGWCWAHGAEVRGAAHQVRHYLIVVFTRSLSGITITVIVITELVVIHEEGKVIEYQFLLPTLPVAFEVVILA